MTKKFTEEQYQKIVEEWEVAISYIDATQAIMDLLDHEDLGEIVEEAFALANPLTREWAHDKYVEEEKKYYWTSKKRDKAGWAIRIMIDNDGLVRGYPTNDPSKHNGDEKVTELEIKAWGFNPDMFDKEEVK